MLARKVLEGPRPVLVSLAALAIVLAIALATIPRDVRLVVSASVPANGRDASGSIVELVVAVRNDGAAAAEPISFVVLGANALPWNGSGPGEVLPGASATFRIQAPCASCGIPAGADYLVRVFDVRSGLQFASPVAQNVG